MITSFLVAAVAASIPLLYGTLGTINNEKVGHLNLGTEGIMILGAYGAFIFGYKTDSILIALLGAMLVSGLTALVYAVLTVTFRTSHAVTGLTITLFGTNLANTLGKTYVGVGMGPNVRTLANKIEIPLLSKIPFIGEVLFSQTIMVYAGILLAVLMYLYYSKTRFGMNIKSVGEDPNTADVNGINVTFYKYFNIVLGGIIIGLGGAYLSLVIIDGWLANLTAGRGWIAVALVVFSSWKPLSALVGAIIFGGLEIVGFYYSLPISQYLIAALPYIATIITLIVISMTGRSKLLKPNSLGLPYFREDR